MKAALYARVSTDDKGQDPELQLRDLRAYCQLQHIEAVEFIDAGLSGTKERRPKLDEMMSRVRAGEFTHVIVWRFDRFGRSAKHLINAMDEFQKLHVQFVSVREQFDTSTPMGRAMFTIIGAMAQLERDLLAERTKAGMALARARGKIIGGCPIDFSTKRDEILELRAAGESCRTIAKRYAYDRNGRTVIPRRAVTSLLKLFVTSAS